MDLKGLFGFSGGNGTDLPTPNVEMRTSADAGEWTEEQVRGMVCNPIYAGIGPYPALIDDKTWVRAAKVAIDECGAEQFLVNLLYLLRLDFKHAKLAP